jgi:FkbM family methyltransferase
MPAAARGRGELVEQREVCASAPCPMPVDLRTYPPRDGTPRPPYRARDAPHGDTVTSPRPMPSVSRLARAVRHSGLPRNARAGLLRLEVARRTRARAAYALPLGASSIYLSHDDYEIDWASFAFVAVDEAYAGDYRGAMVVDVGAHKGYYAAYALARGARGVVSYEPETANFALLERAAAAARERGSAWHTRRCAVGAEPGEAELHVMGASWGHALHPPDAFAKHATGSERVRVVAFADVLEEAVARSDGARVIVKVNIEGEECPMILGTHRSAWDGIDGLYVETHPWASCGADELARHLEAAGLSRTESSHPLVLRMRRSAAA